MPIWGFNDDLLMLLLLVLNDPSPPQTSSGRLASGKPKRLQYSNETRKTIGESQGSGGGGLHDGAQDFSCRLTGAACRCLDLCLPMRACQVYRQRVCACVCVQGSVCTRGARRTREQLGLCVKQGRLVHSVLLSLSWVRVLVGEEYKIGFNAGRACARVCTRARAEADRRI